MRDLYSTSDERLTSVRSPRRWIDTFDYAKHGAAQRVCRTKTHQHGKPATLLAAGCLGNTPLQRRNDEMMQRMAFAKIGFLLVAAFLAAPSSSFGQSEVRILSDASISALEDLFEAGRTLEQSGRWAEAITHYEQGLRDHPGNRELQQRLDLTRMHYDLARRYNDRSFRQAIESLDTQRALDLYSEVLLKIGAHYVTNPKWHQIVSRGTTALDVALSETTFLENNLRGVSSELIDAFRRRMYQLVGTRSIRNRIDAQQTVASVAQLANQMLGLTPAVVVLEYTSGAAGGLDNYCTYLTSDQLRDIYSQIEGNFVGLGVELKASNGALLLVHVIPGSPAKQAGLVPGDRIVEVNGTSTDQTSTDEAASMLQGPEHTYVRVTVLSKDGQRRTLRIRREHVDVPSIEDAKIVDRQLGMAYLKLTAFQKTTVRDLDTALWSLHRQGMRSLIIDLRGNPGGLLTTSVEAADRFVQSGTIVSTRGRSPQEDYDYRAHQAGTWRVPLFVLIDGNSASASEIFAGAIRDNRRGTIIGARSFGKGSVQGIFPLNIAGAGLRLTTAKFYSPNGHPISKVGVHPDIVVRHAAKVTDQGEIPVAGPDPAIEAAIQTARQRLAVR